MDPTSADLPPSQEPSPQRGMRRRAARGVFWTVARTWVTQAGGLLTFLVLARILPPAAFGLIALAALFLDLVDTVVDQGFGSAIVQRENLEPGHLDSAFWISILTGTVCLAATVVAAPAIAALLRAPELTPVLRVMAVTFLLVALRGVHEAQLRRQLDFRALALRSWTAMVAGSVIGIAAALAGFGVWSLVVQQIVREAAGTIVLWTASPWRPGGRATLRHVRELWGFSVNVVGSQLAVFATRRVADLLIGRALGTTALGYYSVGQRLVQAVTRMLINSLAGVALPTFSRLQGNPERIRAAFYKATRYSSLIAFPAFLGLAALAPEIVPAWFGARWLPSVRVMQLVALLGLTQSMAAFNGALLQAVGQPHQQFRLHLYGGLVTVAAVLIALPYGIEAVALALVIRALLFAPFSAWIMRRYVGWDVPTYLRQFAPALFGGLSVLLVALVVRSLLANYLGVVPLLVVAAITCGSAYLATVYVTAPGTLAEARMIMREAVPRRLGRSTRTPS